MRQTIASDCYWQICLLNQVCSSSIDELYCPKKKRNTKLWKAQYKSRSYTFNRTNIYVLLDASVRPQAIFLLEIRTSSIFNLGVSSCPTAYVTESGTQFSVNTWLIWITQNRWNTPRRAYTSVISHETTLVDRLCPDINSCRQAQWHITHCRHSFSFSSRTSRI